METAHYINTQMTKVGVQTPVETAHYINTQMTKVGVQTPVEIAHYIKYTNDCLRKTKVLCIDVRHFAHHDVGTIMHHCLLLNHLGSSETDETTDGKQVNYGLQVKSHQVLCCVNCCAFYHMKKYLISIDWLALNDVL